MAVETRLEAQPLARRFLSLVNSIGYGWDMSGRPSFPLSFPRRTACLGAVDASSSYGPVRCTCDSMDTNFASWSNRKVSPSDFMTIPFPLRQGALARVALREES
jgi:hypothetical protein